MRGPVWLEQREGGEGEGKEGQGRPGRAPEAVLMMLAPPWSVMGDLEASGQRGAMIWLWFQSNHCGRCCEEGLEAGGGQLPRAH